MQKLFEKKCSPSHKTIHTIFDQMQKSFLFLLIILTTSCSRNRLIHSDKSEIELSASNDTICVRNYYSTGRVKETVDYSFNKIVSNSIYNFSGILMNKPIVILDQDTNASKHLCILLPYDSLLSYDVFISGKINNEISEIDSLVNLRRSTEMAVKAEYVQDHRISGVVRSKIKNQYNYYPFNVVDSIAP